MRVRRLGAGKRGRGGALVATVVLLASSGQPQAAQGQEEDLCRITSADAFLYADTTRGDLITYYGQVIMYTAHCDISPAEVQATFRPVAGQPSACDFRGTLFSEYALCRGAQGVAGTGTPVVVDVTGRTYGSNGADLFASSCVLISSSLPPVEGAHSSASRGSCQLPLE